MIYRDAAAYWMPRFAGHDDGKLSWATASFRGSELPGPVCAISRFSSGMHEPQLVPAFSFAPMSAAERAPAAMVSQIVLRPTPKQAQTIGPALARPSARFARQQHAALVVAERIRGEQVLDDVPVAGIPRGPDEQAGCRYGRRLKDAAR